MYGAIKKKSHEGIAEKFRKGREKTVTVEKIKLLLLLFLCILKAKNKAFLGNNLSNIGLRSQQGILIIQVLS